MMNERLGYKKEVKARDLEVLAQYRENAVAQPRLVYLFLELTDACNLSCAHCGSPRSNGCPTMLKTSSALKAIDSLANSFTLGTVMLCLTGGEPMLHPDLLMIARAAYEQGVPWGMTTNGTLIDKKAAKELVALGLGSISVSLDGMARQHDRLRCRSGSFDAAVRGIEALVDAGAQVQVTTVVHANNIGKLEEFRSFVKTLGVVSWRIVNIEPIGRALLHPELMLKAHEFKYMLDYVRTIRREEQCLEVCYGCSHYLSFDYEREVRDYYFQCGAGREVASVLCNGDIYGCLDIERRPELIQGNIEVDDFGEVWRNGFSCFRTDKTLLCADCNRCAERRYCGGDSAHTWDFALNKPRFCYKDWFGMEVGHG